MLDFVKKLLSVGIKNLTVIVWEDATPDQTETYRIKPSRMLGLLFLSNVVAVCIVFLFFFLTPLGNILFDREDQLIQRQLVEIRERVYNLRDSLDAREIQMTNFKRVLAASMDTTFQTSLEGREMAWMSDYEPEIYPDFDDVPDYFETVNEIRGLRSDEIMLSNERFFEGIVDFPAIFPLEGSPTRQFDIARNHFGIDIAAVEGTYVRAFSDGIVLFAGWTVNYGYVITLQHAEGYVSMYKHCHNLMRSKGDFVRTGDIIGRVGSYGLISSGPHLHFELWQDGMPLNPSDYFSNL